DRDEPSTVRIEGHTSELITMSLENSWTRTVGGVPQTDRPVRAGRRNPAPVRAQRDPVEPTGVAEVTRHFLPAVNIPHLQDLIVTARGQPFAVRAEGHASYLRSMAQEDSQLLAAAEVPYPHGPIHAS